MVVGPALLQILPPTDLLFEEAVGHHRVVGVTDPSVGLPIAPAIGAAHPGGHVVPRVAAGVGRVGFLVGDGVTIGDRPDRRLPATRTVVLFRRPAVPRDAGVVVERVLDQTPEIPERAVARSARDASGEVVAGLGVHGQVRIPHLVAHDLGVRGEGEQAQVQVLRVAVVAHGLIGGADLADAVQARRVHGADPAILAVHAILPRRALAFAVLGVAGLRGAVLAVVLAGDLGVDAASLAVARIRGARVAVVTGDVGVSAAGLAIAAVAGAGIAIVAVHVLGAALTLEARVAFGAGVVIVARVAGQQLVLASLGEVARIVGADVAVIAVHVRARSAFAIGAHVALGAGVAILARVRVVLVLAAVDHVARIVGADVVVIAVHVRAAFAASVGHADLALCTRVAVVAAQRDAVEIGAVGVAVAIVVQAITAGRLRRRNRLVGEATQIEQALGDPGVVLARNHRILDEEALPVELHVELLAGVAHPQGQRRGLDVAFGLVVDVRRCNRLLVVAEVAAAGEQNAHPDGNDLECDASHR